MEIDIEEDYTQILRKVYNPIGLETSEGNKMYVCMRDDTFEFTVVPKGGKYKRTFRIIMDENNIEFMKETEQKQKSKVKIIKYWAEWCGPCKMFAPILEEISKEMGIEVESIDVENDISPEEVADIGINRLPTIQLVVDGDIKETITGICQKDDLMEKIKSL